LATGFSRCGSICAQVSAVGATDVQAQIYASWTTELASRKGLSPLRGSTPRVKTPPAKADGCRNIAATRLKWPTSSRGFYARVSTLLLVILSLTSMAFAQID